MSYRVLVAVLLLAPTLAGAAPVASELMAGAARIDITPPQSAMPPGDTIRDHLYVRAIVIKNKSGGCYRRSSTRSRTRSIRSLPQKSSSSTRYAGTPNTPLASASARRRS